MAKAAKASTGNAARAEAVRISIVTAGEMLVKRFANMHMAATQLDEAIRSSTVQLFADDHPETISPNFFARHLRVEAVVNGSRLEIRPTRALAKTYTWTVDRDDVRKLVEGNDAPPTTSNPPKHKAGRKPIYDPELVEREAWAYVYEHGCPASLESLAIGLKVAVGEGIPEITKAKEILRPVYDRMEQLRAQIGEKPGKERTRR